MTVNKVKPDEKALHQRRSFQKLKEEACLANGKIRKNVKSYKFDEYFQVRSERKLIYIYVTEITRRKEKKEKNQNWATLGADQMD